MFGGIFFVFKSLLGIERQKKLLIKKISFLTRKPDISHVAKHRARDESHVMWDSRFCSQV